MGDITVPAKSYRNIQKLLQHLGISVEKMGRKANLWNKYSEPTQEEELFARRYLSLVEENLAAKIT